MTTLRRSRKCCYCGLKFIENKSDSHKQWRNRLFCSKSCSNKDKRMVVDIFVRLEKFQIKSDGCWEWRGTKDAGGYGRLSNREGRRGSPEKAHRVSFEKAFGAFDKNLHVLHRCDNPECTNPDHLFLGTHQDNMKDMVSKNRQQRVSRYGADNHVALFTVKQIERIRSLYASGEYTYIMLAAKFSACRDTIRKIVNNKTYFDKNYIYSRVGNKKKRPSRKLKIKIEDILKMRRAGLSSRKIAKILGCSKTTILNREIENAQ